MVSSLETSSLLEDLVRMAEEIHDRISSETPEGVQEYLNNLRTENPALADPIEGLELTTGEFLVQVARGEHDFKVLPLTAYRPVPKNESIRY